MSIRLHFILHHLLLLKILFFFAERGIIYLCHQLPLPCHYYYFQS
ncbi:hypothetical protein KPK_4727 [Klebsiella variicola]|uniref:Uncharacterized protein n=1 Tax=Klebsiella variicola (strain 342) TaxID=507522 RepID=B5Y227_KLEV3|nr:hypothetical protein KPK_4727 [Klebsiella variicola]